MENYLYRINKKDGNYEIGYFIQLKDKNGKNYLALVTSPNVLKDIDNNSLKIIIDDEPKSIELGDIIYENKVFNKAVIEIKDKSNIKYFFEIDENTYKSKEEISTNYYNESIYIIQYDNRDNILLSYGIINGVCDNEIKYSSNIKSNIKHSIILNLNNNKIIGININESNKGKNGKLINDLIDRFIFKINHKLISDKYKETIKNTNIFIIINIDKKDVNKNIYFLDNYYYDENGDKKYSHEHLKELNENNTELYINNNKMEKYEKYFKPEKEGEYMIELRFNINLTDCSYMFSGCENIKYIHFSNFITTNLQNM